MNIYEAMKEIKLDEKCRLFRPIFFDDKKYDFDTDTDRKVYDIIKKPPDKAGGRRRLGEIFVLLCFRPKLFVRSVDRFLYLMACNTVSADNFTD